MNNRLTARVLAKNTVNAKANELAPKFREIFAPYVGKKIFKANRSFIAEITEKLKPFLYPQKKEFQIWCHRLEHSLIFKIKCSKQIGGHSSREYAEANIQIGSLDGQILKAIEELVYLLPTIYLAAGVEHARARARELEYQLSVVRSAAAGVEHARARARELAYQLSVVRSEYGCFGENDFSKVEAE
jgi:hypothetical protein